VQETKLGRVSSMPNTAQMMNGVGKTAVKNDGTFVSKISLNEQPVVTSERMRVVFNGVVMNHLPVFVLSVGLIHVLLAGGYRVLLPNHIAVPMSLIALGIAFVSLTVWLSLTRWPPSLRLSHPILTIISLLAVVNALAYMYLAGEMRQTMLVFFVVLAVAQFFLSVRWFFFVLGTIFIAWIAVVWQLSSSPVYFGGILIVGIVISIVMFYVRRQSILQYEGLRLRDEWRRQELRNRARQFETNLAVGQQINSILELNELLNEVAEMIQTQYDYDYVGIFLLNETGTRLRIKAGTGTAGKQLCKDEAELSVDEQSMVGWVAVNGRHLCVNDVSQDYRYVPFNQEKAVRAELDLPLWAGNKMLGVLTLQSEQIGVFRENDMRFLQLLSTQVAIAIYNASLFQREKSARNLAETLQDTGRALTSTLEWNAVIDLILEWLSGIVPYDRGSVLVRRENELEIVAARGFPVDSQPRQIRISLENESIFREIDETKRPLFIQDVSERSDWKKVGSLAQARSWLGVPLIHGGRVTGMLSLTRLKVKPYTEDELTLATAFARQASIALENARLYEQTTRFNQQLEYEVKQRTEAIQTAYQQLEHLNRTKSDFISIVSHELRTPVTILSGYSQMLMQDQTIQSSEGLQHLAIGMQSGAVRLEEIINTMLDVAKIDNAELKLYPDALSIPALVEMVALDFEKPLADRQLTLQIESMDTLPEMFADKESLKKVFYHLMTNAIKYTPDGGSITVFGKTWTQGNSGIDTPAVELVFKDTGIGVDPTMHELIFDKFYQTGKVSLHSTSKTQFKGGGPGLGLAVCRGIVQAHRGKLWVESPRYDEESCPGSEFHLVLPLLSKDEWGEQRA
jgi:signal transduction histidine kinase